jgi:hypothetical protein
MGCFIDDKTANKLEEAKKSIKKELLKELKNKEKK